MKKKIGLVILFLVLFFAGKGPAATASLISITGAVKQPLSLTMEELSCYQSIRIQLNEVMSDGEFRGVFYYRGVPLRRLLELACIQKEETDFAKSVDLAILVRNKQGKQVVLSWGEVFYRNPGRIIVAISAVPIMPHKDCKACHGPEVYKSRMDQLQRKIMFPKLVITGDIYTDRSLEEITSIEVLNLRPRMPAKKLKKLFSPKFTITGMVGQPVTINNLISYPRKKMMVKHLGEGKGYHGIDRFAGVSFKTILDEAGIEPDLSKVFLVSAPDGYRSLFSYGEIFLDPAGERMLIADRINDKPIKKGGRFFLVPPDDLMSDRDVKSIEKIEVISLRKTPKLYVIGIGCGDTNLITLEAITHMAKADVFVCTPDIKKRFSKYMGDKPVLFDLYKFAAPVLKRENPRLSPTKLEELFDEAHTRAAGIIQDALDKKKTVAILDYGDPTIWSGSNYMRKSFKENITEIIPGLSSFNASNALIKKRIGCNGSVVLTTHRGLMDNRAMFEALARKGETLCIFMGIKDLPNLMPLFKECYTGKTPACLVYKAGYSGSEHLIETTLDGLPGAADGYHEKYLGLIYVGPCLTAKKIFEH